jgi:DNA-binding IclR family transcriptional regulator
VPERSATKAAAPVQSVARAAQLLKVIGAADRPPTVGELAAACGLQRATAWRLLITLEQNDLVERTGPRSGFRVGPGLLSMRSATATELERLARVARPELEHLAKSTGLAAGVAGVRLGRVHVVEQVDPPSVVVVRWVGREFPLHTSSPGKLVLAYMGETELSQFLKRPLVRLTPRTITARDALRKELLHVRQVGFAVSNEEFEVGCVGISAPVEDRDGALRAVIAVTGPNYRMPGKRLAGVAAAVQASARRTAEALFPGRLA